jgi:putative aldouronate transport system permease protein
MKAQSKKGGTSLHHALVYIRQHWQLYLIFMLPAVALTIIFKYIPMGGILIAFTEYNPIRGILGSEWVGFTNFKRFLSSPDFGRYLVNTLKLSVFGLFWGFPVPIHAKFCFGHSPLRYRKNFPVSYRTSQLTSRDEH